MKVVNELSDELKLQNCSEQYFYILQLDGLEYFLAFVGEGRYCWVPITKPIHIPSVHNIVEITYSSILEAVGEALKRNLVVDAFRNQPSLYQTLHERHS